MGCSGQPIGNWRHEQGGSPDLGQLMALDDAGFQACIIHVCTVYYTFVASVRKKATTSAHIGGNIHYLRTCITIPLDCYLSNK